MMTKVKSNISSMTANYQLENKISSPLILFVAAAPLYIIYTQYSRDHITVTSNTTKCISKFLGCVSSWKNTLTLTISKRKQVHSAYYSEIKKEKKMLLHIHFPNYSAFLSACFVLLIACECLSSANFEFTSLLSLKYLSKARGRNCGIKKPNRLIEKYARLATANPFPNQYHVTS